jgi:hypothetical protein
MKRLGYVMASEFNIGYVCPGFYPIGARDLVHAASLFALWKARRRFGPSGRFVQLVVLEQIRGGSTFEVRLIGNEGAMGEIYRFTVMVDDDPNSIDNNEPLPS